MITVAPAGCRDNRATGHGPLRHDPAVLTVTEAVRCALRAADIAGLRVTDAEVLADGSNVLVRLRGAEVVARVATVTALVRPGVRDWLARDVALARWLAERGAPVVTPIDEAGPYDLAGTAVTLWRYLPHEKDVQPGPAEATRALAELHEVMADYPGELPADGPLGDTRRAVELLAGHVDDETRHALLAETDELAAAIAGLPTRPLHGDSHRWNLLVTADGPVWNDFEDTWRGPLGWDLACLDASGGANRDEALATYPTLPSRDELDLCLRLRQVFGVVWANVMTLRFPEEAPRAVRFVAEWRAGLLG